MSRESRDVAELTASATCFSAVSARRRRSDFRRMVVDSMLNAPLSDVSADASGRLAGRVLLFVGVLGRSAIGFSRTITPVSQTAVGSFRFELRRFMVTLVTIWPVSALDSVSARHLPAAVQPTELYLQAAQVGIRKFHGGHGDDGLRQPIYREFQALDVHDQLELRVCQEISAQKILEPGFVESRRVTVVVGDVRQYIARVARFSGRLHVADEC